MKYLVTGGAGFIGSNIVEELIRRGDDVRVIDNFSTGKRENLKQFEKDITLIEGDIRSYHTVIDAVKGVDVVIHQAALPSVPRSIADPISSNDVIVNGTLNLLYASKQENVNRLVFASSSSIYGDTPKLPKHESMIPNPLSPYAVSKLAAEKYFSVFARIYGLETFSLRYFNVFGPRQDPNSHYSAVIPKFIAALLKDKQPVIYGDGEQTRDFTYIDNVVAGNLLASTVVGCESGLVMNCACHERISLNSLVDTLNKILGKNIRPKYVDPRKGDIKHSYASIELIAEKLNYRPSVKFEEGIRKTVEYYREYFSTFTL